MHKTALLISFLIFLSGFSVTAQVWQHPKKAEEVNSLDHEKSSHLAHKKVIIADSNLYGVFVKYRAYDGEGKIKLEAIENRDTVYYGYNENGRRNLVINGNDTIRTIFEKLPNGDIKREVTISKESKRTISYEYDSSRNITHTYVDSFLYEKFAYDDQNRVSNFKRFKKNRLTREINYHYENDTIYYTVCIYQESGEKYDWPCEETKGIYTDFGKVEFIQSIAHDTSGPVRSTVKFFYDNKNRIIEITDTLSNGAYGKLNLFYKDDLQIRAESYSSDKLVKVTRYTYID